MTTLRPGSKVSIAASSFSIYAFQELKDQLSDISELRFIFTAPSFITEKTDKQKREFYIPRLNRERNLYGSEFEIKLRTELSLKAVAKECAAWIRKKVCFKSNRTDAGMPAFATVDDTTYMPLNGETRDGQRMGTYFRLLGDAIASIVKVKEQSDLFSFFEGDPTRFSVIWSRDLMILN